MLKTAEQFTTDKQKKTDLAKTDTLETHSTLEDIIAWSQISAQGKVYEENKILGQFKAQVLEESSPVIGKIPREDLPSEEKDVHAESTLKGEIPARKNSTSAVDTNIATKINISLYHSKVETEYFDRELFFNNFLRSFHAMKETPIHQQRLCKLTTSHRQTLLCLTMRYTFT